MTIREAQTIALRVANLNSKTVTKEEIRKALVTLANFAEDILFTVETFNKEIK
jgi:hypothetical protein